MNFQKLKFHRGTGLTYIPNELHTYDMKEKKSKLCDNIKNIHPDRASYRGGVSNGAKYRKGQERDK